MARRTIVEQLVSQVIFEADYENVERYEETIKSVSDTVKDFGTAISAVALDAGRELYALAADMESTWGGLTRRLQANLMLLGETTDAMELIRSIAADMPTIDVEQAAAIVSTAAATPGIQQFDFATVARQAAAFAAGTGVDPSEAARLLVEGATSTGISPRDLANLSVGLGGFGPGASELIEAWLADATSFRGAVTAGFSAEDMLSLIAQGSAAGAGDFDRVAGRLEPIVAAVLKQDEINELGLTNLSEASQTGDIVRFISEAMLLPTASQERLFGEEALGLLEILRDQGMQLAGLTEEQAAALDTFISQAEPSSGETAREATQMAQMELVSSTNALKTAVDGLRTWYLQNFPVAGTGGEMFGGTAMDMFIEWAPLLFLRRGLAGKGGGSSGAGQAAKGAAQRVGRAAQGVGRGIGNFMTMGKLGMAGGLSMPSIFDPDYAMLPGETPEEYLFRMQEEGPMAQMWGQSYTHKRNKTLGMYDHLMHPLAGNPTATNNTNQTINITVEVPFGADADEIGDAIARAQQEALTDMTTASQSGVER